MAGLHFNITGDNSNFLRKLEESRNGVRNTSKQIEESGLTIEQMFKRLTSAAAAFGVGFGAKQLVSDITRVRGEFQQLEVAFTTMLGSKEKADSLMNQLVATAAKTPFDLQGVANGAKQLLAYGVAAEEINGTLVRLGDIAAGLSIPLGDLVYLYGTTRAQGRLYTEDLNQFTGRGIPMIQELAKHFGVAEDKIKDMVSQGKVGFPEVQKVIESLTNEGGKFGGLMEAQSKTITGQISNIEDSITNLYNKIGQSSEGVINLALSGVSNLLENYEKVGEAIAVAVTAYGSYKAALMATTAIQSMNNKVLRQAVVEKSLAAASGISLSNAEAVAAARTKMLTLAQNGLVKSLKATAAATLANPYVMMAAAVTSLAYGIYKLTTYETDAEKAQRSLNEAIAESEAASLSEQRELAKLKGELTALSKGTKEYEDVKNKIIKGFGKYYEGLDEEISRVGLTEAAYNKLTDAIKNSYGARQYEKFSKEQQSNLDASVSENLLKIQERLYKELGEEEGAKVYTTLRNKLFSKEIALGKGEEGLVGIEGELKKSLDIAAGADGGLFDFQNREVEGFIRAILKAQKIADEIEKKARVRFGIGDDYMNSGDSNTDTKTIEVKDKTYWEQKKKEAESSLYALDISKKGSVEWNKYIKEINEAQKQIDKYSSPRVTKTNDDENRLELQERLNKQLLSLQRKNQQEEVALMDEGREKKLAKINADFEAQKQAIEKQAKELADANKEAKTKGLNNDGLTADQQAEIDKANELNEKSREKAENDVYRAELEAMRNYLKEYGTFQEQKLAIAEEYAHKIAKAQSEGERLSLQKQRDSALLNVDIAAAKQNINWQSVFGDLGMILKEQIQPTIDNLKKLTESEEFKNASYEDQNQIYDLISELESQSGELGGSFKQVAQDLELYRNSLNAYNTAYSRQIEAANKLAEAQKKLKLTKENGGDVSSAEREVEEAQQVFNESTESVKALGEKASENANTLQNSSSKVKNSLEGLASNFDKLKSGSLSDAFDGIKGIGKQLGGKIGDAIANIDPTGIIGGVLSIMDVLKDGVSTIFVSLQDALFGAVNGILSDVLSGDIVVKTWKGVASNVGNLFNTITFGGFNKLFGIGGNGKEVEHAINRLTDRNETLQTAIEDLTDEMKASKGSKSVEAYNEAKRRQEEVNRNYLQIAQEQARYSKSHHSWNYYWRGFDQSQIAEFSKKIGRDWNGDIWDLSPEEMKQLRETVDMWNQIQTTGKGGYGERLTEKLDDYIEQAGKIDELQKDLFEGLTGITFESMYDSYISTLMDMTKSAEDAADDISKYFMQAMLSNAIGEQMYDKLKAWYDKFGEYMKEGGLSEDERNNLLNGNEKEGIIGWNEIIKQGFELRDELAAATGYDKTFSKQQEASRGFGTEMTHEDAGELSGRFTALQITGEESKNAILNMLAVAQTISLSAKDSNEVLSEIRNLMILSNGYLEDISEYAKKMISDFGGKLNSINESIKKAL